MPKFYDTSVTCYWCKAIFSNITVEHFKMNEGVYFCPHHLENNEKHLIPYIPTKGEKAIDEAFEKRTH